MEQKKRTYLFRTPNMGSGTIDRTSVYHRNDIDLYHGIFNRYFRNCGRSSRTDYDFSNGLGCH